MSLDLTMGIVLSVTLFLAGLFLATAIGNRLTRNKVAEPVAPAPVLSAEAALQQLVERGGNTRVLMEGGFRLRDSFSAPDGFTVRGSLVLEDDSELDGLVEVFGDAVLGARARTLRPIYVHGDLTLGIDAHLPSCRVGGSVFFHPGSRVEGSLHCNALYLVEGHPTSEEPMSMEIEAPEQRPY